MSPMTQRRSPIQRDHLRQEKARHEVQNRESFRAAPEEAHDIVVDFEAVGWRANSTSVLRHTRKGCRQSHTLVLANKGQEIHTSENA